MHRSKFPCFNNRIYTSTIGIPLLALLVILASCTTDPDNSAPTASFIISPESGGIETEFLFDANSCSDPEEDSSHLQVRWDWESDGIWDTLWGNGKKREHYFDSSGVYTVTLEVRDSWGESDSTTRELQVLDILAH